MRYDNVKVEVEAKKHKVDMKEGIFTSKASLQGGESDESYVKPYKNSYGNRCRAKNIQLCAQRCRANLVEPMT